MRKRQIKVQSCFLMGIFAGILNLGAGLLVAMGQGAASYLRMAGFVMFGAMLLFLAAAERGYQKKRTRIALMLLFMGWMIAWFPLPPLSGIFGCIVPVVFTAWYRRKDFTLLWAGLFAAEVIQAVVLTFSIMPWYGRWHNQIVGISILLAGAMRAAILAVMYRREAENW